MTLMTDLAAVVEDDGDANPRFTPEHYGCPAWCTVNVRGWAPNYIGHDSGDGMPDKPGFDGYRHWTGLYLPHEADPYDEPLSIHLNLGKDGRAVIAIRHSDEVWAEFNLDEAQALAERIAGIAATAGHHCPPWCPRDHSGEDAFDMDGDWHNASENLDRAAGAPYLLDIVQEAPVIELHDGGHDETLTLRLPEALRAAGAIAELVRAAREGRPVHWANAS